MYTLKFTLSGVKESKAQRSLDACLGLELDVYWWSCGFQTTRISKGWLQFIYIHVLITSIVTVLVDVCILMFVHFTFFILLSFMLLFILLSFPSIFFLLFFSPLLLFLFSLFSFTELIYFLACLSVCLLSQDLCGTIVSLIRGTWCLFLNSCYNSYNRRLQMIYLYQKLLTPSGRKHGRVCLCWPPLICWSYD